MRNKYQVNGVQIGFNNAGFGMMGLQAQMAAAAAATVPAAAVVPVPEVAAAPVPEAAAEPGCKCVYCKADVTGMKFCPECGAEVK